MFQDKYCGGYEIQIIGKGENGLCRVEHQTGSTDSKTCHTGTWETCKAWLAKRGIKPSPVR